MLGRRVHIPADLRPPLRAKRGPAHTGSKIREWGWTKGAQSGAASGARLVNRRAGGLVALDVGIREIVSLEEKRLIERAR